jgi:transketolase
LDTAVKTGAGHVTSSFSCAEILTILYYGNILRYNPKNPSWDRRDRFIMSKGHASIILYPILAELGFFPKEWLNTSCQENGRIGLHLQHDVPGVETTAGSLGHGLGIGVGMALAAKMDKKKYFTFVLLSDGECQEGSTWEATMLAGQHGLNNLIAIIDRNFLCATDFTEKCVKLKPLDKKWKSFGWDVAEIDGHSVEDILHAFKDFRTKKRDKPYVIICNTIKGKGVSFMENKPLWHGRVPKGVEITQAKNELNIGE